MCCFPLKIGERGVLGHVKVRRDKRHHPKAREKLLENRRCISRRKLDDSDRFGATPAGELRLASGTEIWTQPTSPKAATSPPGATPFHQCDRGGRDPPALAPANGEQREGT